MHFQEVLEFWFSELSPKQWWVKDLELDKAIGERFATLHAQAACSELFDWRHSAEGRLAEIIILDQLSRNMFRDTSAAFATDPLSLSLSQHAVALGLDSDLDESQRIFLYMPHMHSESAKVHEQAARLFSKAGEQTEGSAKSHRDIIDRFGRYPHRNAILGRTSTAEELEFLSQPGSSF